MASRSNPPRSNSATISGHEVEFTAPYAKSKIKRRQPLALDEYHFPARRYQGDWQDHAAGAIDHAFLSLQRFCRRRRLMQMSKRSSLISPQIFRQEIGELAAAGCRYIQLDEVAVALLCDPAIRDQDRAVGQQSRRIGRSLYRQHQPGRVGVPGRGHYRRAHVPRQLQRPLSRRRAAMNPSPSASLRTPRSITSCLNTTRRARAISRRCVSYRKPRVSCLA